MNMYMVSYWINSHPITIFSFKINNSTFFCAGPDMAPSQEASSLPVTSGPVSSFSLSQDFKKQPSSFLDALSDDDTNWSLLEDCSDSQSNKCECALLIFEQGSFQGKCLNLHGFRDLIKVNIVFYKLRIY